MLIPEPKPDNPSDTSPQAITDDNEPFLDRTMMVNMDLTKIHVTRDQDYTASEAKYVSLNITVQSLLNCLSEKFFFTPHKAVLLHRSSQYGTTELENKKKTLAELGVNEDSFLSISVSSDSILGFQTTSPNQANYERDDADSNKGNDGEDRHARNPDSQDLDFDGM